MEELDAAWNDCRQISGPGGTFVLQFVDSETARRSNVLLPSFNRTSTFWAVQISPRKAILYARRDRLASVACRAEAFIRQFRQERGGRDVDRQLAVDIDGLSSATRAILIVNADNYTALNIRKALILKDVSVPRTAEVNELSTIDVLLTKHPKSVELWAHRRWVFERLVCQARDNGVYVNAAVVRREHAACVRAAEVHPKNYLSWTYRAWLLHAVRLGRIALQSQIAALNSFLAAHPDDSAATHYRQVALLCVPEDSRDWTAELRACAQNIARYPQHEVIWQHRRFVWSQMLQLPPSSSSVATASPSTHLVDSQQCTAGELFHAEWSFCAPFVFGVRGADGIRYWPSRHLQWLRMYILSLVQKLDRAWLSATSEFCALVEDSLNPSKTSAAVADFVKRQPVHVVWDIGGVLLRWDPCAITHDYVEQARKTGVDLPDGAELELGKVCTSALWAALDRGDATPSSVAEQLCADESLGNETRAECLKLNRETIEMFLKTFAEHMIPLPNGINLLRRVRAKQLASKTSGRKSLVLSNFHDSAFEMVKGLHSFFAECFDGTTLSCRVHANKPDGRIYSALIREHGVEPGNCLFIDDREENVIAARTAGFGAILYDKPLRVEKELRMFDLL